MEEINHIINNNTFDYSELFTSVDDDTRELTVDG
jgi:hypothetical protein